MEQITLTFWLTLIARHRHPVGILRRDQPSGSTQGRFSGSPTVARLSPHMDCWGCSQHGSEQTCRPPWWR